MLIIQRPEIESGEAEGNVQRFTISPLEPGFGHTLGNSLRRTLLSSIPGAAVTQVRFDDALHEFYVIKGVKEDVTDVILNLKDLVLTCESDEPVTLRGALVEMGVHERTGAEHRARVTNAGAGVHAGELATAHQVAGDPHELAVGDLERHVAHSRRQRALGDVDCRLDIVGDGLVEPDDVAHPGREPAMVRGDRLQMAGVTQVSGGTWCTVEERSRFFSFRRDGVTGRMAAAVWIRR